MRAFLSFLVVLGIAAGVLAYFSLFTVHQTERAMVLQLGSVQKEISEPGLHFKIPFVQNVVYFDKKLLEVDVPSREILIAGKKRIIIDAFARYKITEPLKFYQNIGSRLQFDSRLFDFVNASFREVLSGASLDDIVKDKRKELMSEVTNIVKQKVQPFGVDVVDVRLKRADLPQQLEQNVYTRMKRERQQEAATYRAEGEEESIKIRAEADRTVIELKAQATKKSEIIRGEGDAERNSVFAEAFNRDPKFFAFYRSMQAYEKGLASGDTRLVITPKSEFFRFFNKPSGE
ncbi:MAG: protein HflC [Methyloligella sp.]|jgi:membrane protease subunit HflC|nr:MAG: protein HflC [Methyloligella sp.]